MFYLLLTIANVVNIFYNIKGSSELLLFAFIALSIALFSEFIRYAFFPYVKINDNSLWISRYYSLLSDLIKWNEVQAIELKWGPSLLLTTKGGKNIIINLYMLPGEAREKIRLSTVWLENGGFVT